MSSGESYDNKGLEHTVLKLDIKNNYGKKSNFFPQNVNLYLFWINQVQ